MELFDAFHSRRKVLGTAHRILLDNSPGFRTGVSSESIAGLSFVSFVYPGKAWSLAFYRHQSANFEATAETQGFFSDPFDLNDGDFVSRALTLPVGGTFRVGDIRTFTDLENRDPCSRWRL